MPVVPSSDRPDGSAPGTVVVRYWASARAEAGVVSDELPVSGPVTLAEVVTAVLARHPDRPRLARVLEVCSVLVDDRPVGSAARDEIAVEAGESVEFLPPFAGG